MTFFNTKLLSTYPFGEKIKSEPLDVPVSGYSTLALSPGALKALQLIMDSYYRFQGKVYPFDFSGVYNYVPKDSHLIELKDEGLITFEPPLFKGRISRETKAVPNLKLILPAPQPKPKPEIIKVLQPEPKVKSSKETLVYLMVDEHTGRTKIGRSVSPSTRERTLQSKTPALFLWACWPGTNADEKDLHKKFAKKRERGEWFSLTEDDRVEVRKYMNLPKHKR